MSATTTRPGSTTERTLHQRVELLERQLAVLQAALVVALRKAGVPVELPSDRPPDIGVSASEGVGLRDLFGGG